jgi:trimeric autotransporter adhesin
MKMKTLIATLAGLVLLFTFTASAQVSAGGDPSTNSTLSSNAPSSPPRLIRFSGAAKDINGKALTGVVGITFALYAEQTGGAALWLETQNVEADASGNYSVLLGATKPDGLPTELFTSAQARWISVQVERQAEQPRTLLVSAPYALKAGDAETVGGLPPSAFVRANAPGNSATEALDGGGNAAVSGVASGRVGGAYSQKAVTGSGTADYIPMWSSSSSIANSVMYQKDSMIGIGTTTPSAPLQVVGEGVFSGNVIAGGAVVGTGFQIGNYLFAYGSYEYQNAFLGWSGNGYATGNDNTAIGLVALYDLTTGQYNTATGSYAMIADTSGSYNTASGFSTLDSNTTGNNNSAYGVYALSANKSGGNNTAIGYQALDVNSSGGYNTASGVNALYANQTGSNNTATGNSALYYNTTGSNNTGSGLNAGVTADGSLLTASNDLFLGANSAMSTGSLSNAAAIGANAEVAESNALVLGSISGVNGATSSTSVGIGTTSPSAALEVQGSSSSTTNTFVAISSATGASAIFATNSATSGSANGGFFTAYSPGGSGVVGINYASGGSAAYFQGNVTVTGTLTKGGGSFKIDDPLDPANKYLSHSFVESPDMMNVYNGNIRTDRRGYAVVILPDYFEALNRDFRYQLTAIGQFAQAIVVRKVKGNRFTIRTSKPGVEVSWQVTGIRHDAWADAHRIPNEEAKPEEERGHYLHPELFGAGPEQQIGLALHEPAAAASQTAVLHKLEKPSINPDRASGSPRVGSR